jgi:2-isopropylmalate synthase
VSLSVDGGDRSQEATGNGPVDALYSAVDQALQPTLGWHPVLTEYEIKAVSAGEDAQGQALVRCRRSSDEGPGALVVSGHGLSTNIIEASLEAYLVAVNKLHGAEINGVSVGFVTQREFESSGGWQGGSLPPVSDSGRRLHERDANS